MTDASKHHVKVENWGGSLESMPIIEIGDFPLYMDGEEHAEKCAAAINARIDEAVAEASRAAAYAELKKMRKKIMRMHRRAQKAEGRTTYMDFRIQDVEAEWQRKASNCWDAGFDEGKKQALAEARQRLRDAGADRWDHQRTDEEAGR